MLAIAGGRRGWSAVWPVPVVWLSPVGILAAVFAASYSASPNSDPAQAPILVALACGLLLPCVILRFLWQEACWRTEQSDRWIWVVAVPLVGALRSWPVAFRATRTAPPAPLANLSSVELSAVPVRHDRPGSNNSPDPSQPGEDAVSEPTVPGRPTSRTRPGSVRSSARLYRLRLPSWLLSAVAVLAAVVTFLWLDKSQLHWYAAEALAPATPIAPIATPTVQPDRVVGVIRKCEAGDASVVFRIGREGCGIPSVDASRRAKIVFNDRLEVTVRTGSGGSYVVTVPPTTNVNVGDVWPLR